ALGLLKENHLGNAGLPDALPLVASVLEDDAGPFFADLMEKGRPDALRAAACTALIEAKEAALLDAGEETRARLMKEIAALRKTAAGDLKMKDLFVGAAMPELKSETLDGKEERLSKYKGKVVVLDVWATWCGPCKAMIPHERELVERLEGKPFALISVSFDEEKETLERFLEKERMPWVHWWNGKRGGIGEALAIRSFPTIFVLDGKGVIRFRGVRGKAMDKAVDRLLAEMAE
ncbi:MAG: TlpA family protein disulfide reductase, partial [Gemmataceae bacterium]|nr:TlpA family protein disulfide reductase [Gemmataceae bacterium]